MQKRQDAHTTKQEKHRLLGPVATVFGASKTGSWRIERPAVNFEDCVACGICARSCPLNVVSVHKEKVQKVEIDFDYCKGCGICANECPRKCIRMEPERSARNVV